MMWPMCIARHAFAGTAEISITRGTDARRTSRG